MPAPKPAFSLILPAYNEAERLPPHLEQVQGYMVSRYGDAHEVIVVDDGSQDRTLDELQRRAANWPQLRWIRHERNQGKGAAVRTGMLAAEGELLLFADADGATPIAEECRLSAAIRDGADLAIGSRLLPAPDIPRKREWFRGLAGRAFAAVARRALGLSVRDTQCGFKMFRREAGRKLFSLGEETGYLFDIEVLALAVRLGYRIAEVPIRWVEVPGGRFRPGRDLPRVFLDLWRLRRRLRRRPAKE